jgi:hypothetical protein
VAEQSAAAIDAGSGRDDDAVAFRY